MGVRDTRPILLLCPVCSQETALPVIIGHPSGDVFTGGSQVTLSCQATGADSLGWSLNGAVILPGTPGFSFGDESLTIGSLTSSEGGGYVCMATNELGTVASAVAEVQIASE